MTLMNRYEFASFGRGQPCKQGETAEKSGCIPSKKEEAGADRGGSKAPAKPTRPSGAKGGAPKGGAGREQGPVSKTRGRGAVGTWTKRYSEQGKGQGWIKGYEQGHSSLSDAKDAFDALDKSSSGTMSKAARQGFLQAWNDHDPHGMRVVEDQAEKWGRQQGRYIKEGALSPRDFVGNINQLPHAELKVWALQGYIRAGGKVNGLQYLWEQSEGEKSDEATGARMRKGKIDYPAGKKGTPYVEQAGENLLQQGRHPDVKDVSDSGNREPQGEGKGGGRDPGNRGESSKKGGGRDGEDLSKEERKSMQEDAEIQGSQEDMWERKRAERQADEDPDYYTKLQKMESGAPGKDKGKKPPASFGRGQPCKQGETAEKSGCIPAKDEGGGGSAAPAQKGESAERSPGPSREDVESSSRESEEESRREESGDKGGKGREAPAGGKPAASGGTPAPEDRKQKLVNHIAKEAGLDPRTITVETHGPHGGVTLVIEEFPGGMGDNAKVLLAMEKVMPKDWVMASMSNRGQKTLFSFSPRDKIAEDVPPEEEVPTTVVKEGSRRIERAMGTDNLALDPRAAPKVPVYRAYDNSGAYVGEYKSLASALNVGWGMSPEDAKVKAQKIEAEGKGGGQGEKPSESPTRKEPSENTQKTREALVRRAGITNRRHQR